MCFWGALVVCEAFRFQGFVEDSEGTNDSEYSDIPLQGPSFQQIGRRSQVQSICKGKYAISIRSPTLYNTKS